MKSVKSLLALAAIFGAATTASAVPSATATVLRLTGSSAYRTPLMNQLYAMMYHSGSEPLAAADDGTGAAKAFNASTYAFVWGHIGTATGTEVIFELNFSGSAAGVQAVVQNATVNTLFPVDTLADAGYAQVITSSSMATLPTIVGHTQSVPADATMSDAAQAATPFLKPSLTDNQVAIVTFDWVANKGLATPATSSSHTAVTTAGSATVVLDSTTGVGAGYTIIGTNIPSTTVASVDSATQITLAAPFSGVLDSATAAVAVTITAPANPLTNMTPQLAQSVFSAGQASLSLFTGNAADESLNVFAIGRNPDSGTRITAFAESAVGISSQVEQYQPTFASGVVSSQTLWPAETVVGISFGTGTSGYSSGSGLVAPLKCTTDAIGGYYVTYLGISDALSAASGGGKILTYNGVPFSTKNVTEGKYTFWSYEHLDYLSSLASPKKNLATTFVNTLVGLATAGNGSSIKLSDMKVVRLVDGGTVTQNY